MANKRQKKKNEKKREKSLKAVSYNIKETKLVELQRLMPVKEVHISGLINPRVLASKKDVIEQKKADGKGKYPKEEAITVWKSKSPEDRRKIVYNIEDGYESYLVAKELEFEKVYVRIIEDEK